MSNILQLAQARQSHVWTWLRTHIDELKTLKTQQEVYDHFTKTSHVYMSKNAFSSAMYALGFERASVKIGDSVKKKYRYTSPTGNTLRDDLELNSTGNVHLCATCGGTGMVYTTPTTSD